MKIFLIICLLFLTSGCNQTDEPALQRARRAQKNDLAAKLALKAGEKTRDIKIGMVTFNRDATLFDEGVRLAVDELNNRPGRLLGRKIHLVLLDDKGNLEEGRRIAQSFADDPDIVAVIGHIFSSISIPVSTTYNYYGILMLSPASTASKLTQQGYPLVFRNIVTDKEIGKQVARFVRRQIVAKKKKILLSNNRENDVAEQDIQVNVMIFNARDDYGRGLANEFEKEAQAIGINVIDRRSYDVVGRKVNVKQELKQWKYRKFDAVFLAGADPEAAEVIKQMRETGINHPVCGGDGLDNRQIISRGGSTVEGMVAAVPYFFDENGIAPSCSREAYEREQKFADAMQKKYHKTPDTWAAQSYDAMMVLAKAIEVAQSTEPFKIAAVLADDSNEIYGWQGVTGPHFFKKNGDVRGWKKDGNGKVVDGKKVVFKVVGSEYVQQQDKMRYYFKIFRDNDIWQCPSR